MRRTEEMAAYLQDYRAERIAAKRAELEKNYTGMLPALGEKTDLLVRTQAAYQETGRQGQLRYLAFLRLRSGGYTQSYETALTMTDKRLYLDKCMDCVYWKPDIVYEGLAGDLEKAGYLLGREFIRLEKYEIFYIQQRLLSDDWELLCAFLPRLVQGIADRITGSSLLLEDELEVLCGGYMEKMQTVCRINTGGERNGKQEKFVSYGR